MAVTGPPDAEPAKGAMRAAEPRCLCPSCPSYPEEDRGKRVAYCLGGASPHRESIEPEDCLCESCEVYKRGGLLGRNFFCLVGPAMKEGLATAVAALAREDAPVVVERGGGARRVGR